MIGEGLKPRPPETRYQDPLEVLAGRCGTCSAVVECLRRDARGPDGKVNLGTWSDLVCMECPNCRARVFLMPAGEFRKLLEKST